MKIELWILRTDSETEVPAIESDDFGRTSASGISKGKSKKSTTTGKRKGSMGMDENIKAKTPIKTLEGHKKAIREIAYSTNYKVLVSVGFDFQVFVWNPYWEKEIITLNGHEAPLVGVNCPAGLECFITCDSKGCVNVWNIKDYSSIQQFHVPNV